MPSVPCESKQAKPSELGSPGLKPDWPYHCSWSAQRVVLGMDDDRWGTFVKGIP